MRARLAIPAFVFSCSLLVFCPAAAQNIVLILSDDQGWTGSSVQMDSRVPTSVSDLYLTPNLERLAAEGMRFSNAYAPAPNCSPTRMSIQTGKTAARLGATDIIDVVPNVQGRAAMPRSWPPAVARAGRAVESSGGWTVLPCSSPACFPLLSTI